MTDWAAKTVLVLGAATRGNMGQAIAARFAAAGAAVTVAGRDGRELHRFAQQIGAAHQPCDITDPASTTALADAAVRHHGRLDIAVNAVGLNQIKPFLAVTPADLRAITDVQFSGVFHFLQAVLGAISDGGSIIQISSVSARAVLPDHAAYMATKAAGDVLIKALALEFGSRGIRLNSIAPGPTIDTPMAAAIMNSSPAVAQLKARMPLGRLGTAEDIADAALWLASDPCFVTGEVIQVNGGRAIPRLF